MTVIRLCAFRAKGLFDVGPRFLGGKIFSEPVRFSGRSPSFRNGIADFLFIPKFNYTVVTQPVAGRMHSNGSFDGCLGELQRHEADVGLFMTYFPSRDENLVIPQITFEDRTAILSIVNHATVLEDIDVLDSFKALTLGTWTTFLFTAFIITFLLTWSSREMKTSICDIIGNYIFRQSQPLYEKWFPRMLSILLSFLAFFVITYFMCLFTTEIVAIDQPFRFSSYDDIISRIDQITPRFSTVRDEAVEFKYGLKGTRERQIWDSIKNRPHFIPHSSKDYLVRWRALLEGKAVDIGNQRSLMVTASRFCVKKLGKKEFGNSDPWVAVDTQAKNIHRGFPLCKNTSEEYTFLVQKKIRKVIEKGLDQKLRQSLAVQALPKDVSPSSYHHCITGTREFDGAGYHHLVASNFKQMSILILFMLYCTWMVLLGEILIRRMKIKWKIRIPIRR